MDNFEFYSPTRFVFGRGAEEKTGALVRKYGGTTALLHQVGWLAVASASVLAGILSLLNSVATGLPEVKNGNSK